MLTQIDPGKIVDYFPGNVFFECGPIFQWKFSWVMLAEPDQEKILQVIFPRKDDCMLWANIAQVIFMWNVVRKVPKNIAQERSYATLS